jgi:type VI secretion system protein ImpL
MKKVLAFLKAHHFWIGVIVLWPVALLLAWLCAGYYGGSREQAWQAMALVSAGTLLLIVLRHYRRIHQEKSIETLVQIEVDQRNTGHADQRELSDRLKHAIALLRSDKAAGGAGGAALSDLPWYLVMGMSASGKTSLLSRSGLATSMAGNANELDSGTRHCDWYFSPEAVLVDTAGRYLVDEESAEHFSGFLRNLHKQRRQAAINGLVLVVSLPELLSGTAQERATLALRMVERIRQYGESLGSTPPIYLMLSKVDLLPGFVEAFDDLDLAARQQPLGMTFSLAELHSYRLRQLMSAKFAGLRAQVRQRVQARMGALGASATSELLNLPAYFDELPSVLEQFLEHFEGNGAGKGPLLVRGLYFTSALQSGGQLNHVIEDQLADEFALHRSSPAAIPPANEAGDRPARSFFITDTFRRVIFPDSMLAVHQQRSARQSPLKPALLSLGVLLGVGYLAWGALAFQNNDTWLETTRGQLGDLANAPDREQQLASGQALEMLRLQLTRIDQYRAQGVPLQMSAGLYHGEDLYVATQAAYLQQLRTQALEPIVKQLQLQLRSFNDFAQETGAQARKVIPLKPANRPNALAMQGRTLLESSKPKLDAPPSLGNVPRSTGDVVNRLIGGARTSANQTRTDAFAALRQAATHRGAADLASQTGGPSLSEDMLGRLDEQQVASIIEAYNRLKLYLVLTQPNAHPDAEFVASTLPTAWAGAVNSPSTQTTSTISHNTPLYLNMLTQGAAPTLPRNDRLIDETRQSLKSFMISRSLADREYLRLQLESDRQFPPLALADLVPEPGRQLIYGSEAVPAMYTRQVWESFVQPQLLKAMTGNLRAENDWVLDGDGGDGLVQKANFVRDFMNRYKRDYAQAWSTFVASVGVRHFTDMANATQRLTLLSDVQHSPVKNLLAAVNENTQWDVPAKHDSVPAGTQPNSSWLKALTALGPKIDEGTVTLSNALPAFDDGVLAERFEPVARLFSAQNAEGADSTVMDRYLAALRKLKVRLTNIQRSQDVGKSSKQLIGETLEGLPTEVTNVRNYVETSVDTSQDALSRSLQGLFIAPIQYSWDTLRDPAGQQIAKAWAQQVAKPWEQIMAHRYPIAAGSANEASVKDLQRFVDPESGLLPNFKRNEIGNLAGGEGLGMSSNAKAAPLVNQGMVRSIDKASSLGQVIASLSDKENGFEIMLEPSSNLTDIIFTLDGQVQHYRNGKTSWNRFTWPGTTSAPGARLDVVNLSGERITVFDFPGRWGLLKMSDSARVADLDGIQQRFSWSAVGAPVSLVVRNYGGVKLTDLANVKSLSALNDLAKAP